MARRFIDGEPLGRLNPVTNSSIGTVGTASGIAVTHKQLGLYVNTIITLTNVAQAVVNGTEYQSTKLWTFPEGRILLFDTEIALTQKTTSILADTLNASSTGALAIGSAAASNVALTSTMANMLPSTAFTSSATINVAGTEVTGQLDTNGDFSELLNLDGTTTATPVYLNSAFATTTDVDADATMVWNGTVELFWFFAGGSSRA